MLHWEMHGRPWIHTLSRLEYPAIWRRKPKNAGGCMSDKQTYKNLSKAEQFIREEARVLRRLEDVYDALRSERPTKKPLTTQNLLRSSPRAMAVPNLRTSIPMYSPPLSNRRTP